MFITFEGIDFCGKSTQVELLKRYLTNRGNKVELIREPGGTEISEKIREILLDKKNYKMFMETEFLLFSASRAQLVREKIKPYLDRGIYVISDRFHDSSSAYQGFGRGINIEKINSVSQMAIGTCIPDITFIIDIPVEEAEIRRKENTSVELDRIEVSENNFYERVRKGYLSIAVNDKRFRIINGLLTKEAIHDKIVNEIVKLEKRELDEKKIY